jgi:4-hydroxybenzoate polyprenyltransferase
MAMTAQRPLSLTALLTLGRASNLPTVWTNVLAGAVLAGGVWHDGRTGVVLVAMSLFYVGGMYLNDYFDRGIDARERPRRPIPAGDVAPDLVAAVGFGLLAAGVALLATIGLAATLYGLALAALIVAYDLFHKGNPVAPVMMGGCRMLVYLGAAAATTGGIPGFVVIASLALLAYIAGLTYAARQENLDRVGNLWPLAVLSAPLIVALPAVAQGPLSAAIYLALIGWTTAAIYLLARRPAPGAVSRAVAALIAGVSLVDAALIASAGASAPALLALAGFAATVLLQRYIAGT